MSPKAQSVARNTALRRGSDAGVDSPYLRKTHAKDFWRAGIMSVAAAGPSLLA